MRILSLTLVSLCMGLFLILSCHAYDIVQVTNTPDMDETEYSVAIFGNTVYAVWVAENELYFDKSTDLGKTWNLYRKVKR